MKRSTAYLDGLRGLASYLVVIQHYAGEFDLMAHELGYGESGNYLIASLPFLRTLLTGGNPAVAIFFVLSGYVLSRSPLKILRKEELRGATRISLLSAAIRRPIRVFVPCLAIGFLTALCMHLPGGPYNNGPFAAQEHVGEEIVNWIVKSAYYFNPFKPDGPPWYHYGMVMWTIPVEYRGSMLVFGLLLLDSFINFRPRYIVAAEFVATILLMVTGNWTMACFIAGLLLAYNDTCGLDNWIQKKLSSRGKSLLFNSTFVLAWYLLCQPAGLGGMQSASDTPGWGTLTWIIPPWYDDHTFFRWWQSWGAILLVYSILRVEWLQRFFTTRILQYLGRISFMLYLVHIPIVWTIGAWLRCALGTCKQVEDELLWKDKMFVPDIGPRGFSLRFLIGMSIITAICVPLAEVFVRLLDNPVVKLGRWITSSLGLERKRKQESEEKDGFSEQPLLGDVSRGCIASDRELTI